MLKTLTPSGFQASLQLVYKVTVRIHYATLTSPHTQVSFNQHTQKCTWCKGGATDVVAQVQNA